MSLTSPALAGGVFFLTLAPSEKPCVSGIIYSNMTNLK